MAESTENLGQTTQTVKLDSKYFFERVKVRMAQLKKRSFSAYAEALIAADLSEGIAQPKNEVAAQAPAYPYPRHRDVHEMLEYILLNDKKAADWITGNLKMFAEALRLRAAVSLDPNAQRRAG